MVCTGVSALLEPYIAPTNPVNVVMVYLLGVVVVALRFGRGPSILASLLGVAAFDFFFVPPRWTFAVGDTRYLLTFLVMLLTGLVISTLTARVQFQAESARRRERRTAALYAIGRELAATHSREQIARIAMRHVTAAAEARVALLLPDQGEKGDRSNLPERSSGSFARIGTVPFFPTEAEAGGFTPSVHDEAVARWVLEHGQTAGRGTATLPGAEAIYLPLSTSRGGSMASAPGRVAVRRAGRLTVSSRRSGLIMYLEVNRAASLP